MGRKLLRVRGGGGEVGEERRESGEGGRREGDVAKGKETEGPPSPPLLSLF